MRSKKINLALTVLSLIIYNFLFWQEKLGINLLLFSSLLSFAIIRVNKESVKHLHVKLLLAGTLFTGLMAVYHNSGISKFTHILSFLLLAGSIHATELRSIYNILFGAITNYIIAPIDAVRNTKEPLHNIQPVSRFFYWIRLLFFPFLIFFLFFTIYNVANTQFGNLFSGFWDLFSRLVERIFNHVSMPRIFFLLLGFFIIKGTFSNKYFGYMLSHESSLSDYITRQKMQRAVSPRPSNIVNYSINVLRKELRSGVILLLALNVILLTLNSIDIKLLWFGFYPESPFNMKAFVHDGTYLLIFSMILSMILVLYFFRKNQNFNKRNKFLKTLSYAWILQNIILLISVCIRNQQYIFYNGLAYKRIGLYAFLLLTAIGLITLIIKIKDLRSFFYLLRINSWTAYVILIAFSIFNWDMRIVKNNLANENGSGIDIDFYLQLSPETYPVLYSNLNKIEEQIAQHQETGVRWTRCNDIDDFKEKLTLKRNTFIKNHFKYSWASWNYSDHAAIINLLQPPPNLTYNTQAWH